LQRQLASEEQGRQQAVSALQRGLELLREELQAEVKERRAQATAAAEAAASAQRSLQQRDERVDMQAQQILEGTTELRERLAREARLREAAVSQLEQRLASAKVPGPGPSPPPATAEAPRLGASGERLRQLEEELEATCQAVASLQAERQSLQKTVSGLDERSAALQAALAAVQRAQEDGLQRRRGVPEVETQTAWREELLRETSERRSESARLSLQLTEGTERLERAEQLRVKAEDGLRQELVDVRAGLKREGRERDQLEAKVIAQLREEACHREEAVDREARQRREAEVRAADALQAAIREERRLREKEALRLEEQALAALGRAPGLPATGGQAAAVATAAEQRGLRQNIAELQERLGAAEARQKSAEERTVGMLDAIMSGLAGPAEQ